MIHKDTICVVDDDENTIAEYNLLTRKTNIICQLDGKIREYFVLDGNVIIGMYDQQKYQICWNGYVLINCDLLWFRVLNAADGLFVANYTSRKFYGLYQTVELGFDIPYFETSHDGRKIVFEIDGKIYVQNVFLLSIDQLFKKSKAKVINVPFNGLPLNWVLGGNCILINGNVIYDLDMEYQIMLPFDCRNAYYTNNGIIVKVENCFVTIYDSLAGQICELDKKLDIGTFHRELNIFITRNLEYWQIHKTSNGFELKQIEFVYLES